jgi:ceramide glucosyltransferase
MSGISLASIIFAICDVCLAGAVVGCVFTLLECALVLRFTGQRPHDTTAQPSVTMLKPLHGAEPGLAARLARFCEQSYAGPVQVIFGVGADDAPAIAVAEQIKAKFPDSDIAIALDAGAGRNRKVAKLIGMLPLSRHDVLVLSDADIIVGRDYLQGIVSLLPPDRVGAVTCLYYGLGEGFWQRLSALAVNAHFLPQAIAGARLGSARYCCGATIALPRTLLDRIGGFGPFADVLADDYAIGAAVRALGYDVVTAPFLVGHQCFDDSLRRLFLHDLRVARTIRSIAPAGYVGTIITHPWPLAVIGLLTGSAVAAVIAGAALAARLALCRCVERRFELPRQSYWLVPLQDIIAFAAYLVSFLGTRVHWRGSQYRVTGEGTLADNGTAQD